MMTASPISAARSAALAISLCTEPSLMAAFIRALAALTLFPD
jgi:hypothetical protein